MDKSHVMILSTKETFLIRALEKKLQEAYVDFVYTSWDINDINSKWANTAVVTIYMDEGDIPPLETLHFLLDKMADADVKIITIGSKEDNQYICDYFSNEMIYKTFNRPIDNDKYVDDVQKMFTMVRMGEMKKTILIVDDDPSYLNLVRGWLKADYKVAMANSGLQAIKWLGRNKADLILLDHEMPVTSGPQVLEMLRNDEETANIPVMFLTGKSDKQSVMGVMALKPQGYFLKSIERDELLRELKAFFVKNK
ncbi:MAG: response regulator [Lachnospiraceae bacterium]|nr:response regulator [Lachnospiraceae bacterium]